jgi:hypothetical protein
MTTLCSCNPFECDFFGSEKGVAAMVWGLRLPLAGPTRLITHVAETLETFYNSMRERFPKAVSIRITSTISF